MDDEYLTIAKLSVYYTRTFVNDFDKNNNRDYYKLKITSNKRFTDVPYQTYSNAFFSVDFGL